MKGENSVSNQRTVACKECLVVVLVLLLLTAFCLANVEAGSGSYYLCIFSLIVDVPFLGFLLYKLIRDYHQIRRARGKETDAKTGKQR